MVNSPHITEVIYDVFKHCLAVLCRHGLDPSMDWIGSGFSGKLCGLDWMTVFPPFFCYTTSILISTTVSKACCFLQIMLHTLLLSVKCRIIYTR